MIRLSATYPTEEFHLALRCPNLRLRSPIPCLDRRLQAEWPGPCRGQTGNRIGGESIDQLSQRRYGMSPGKELSQLLRTQQKCEQHSLDLGLYQVSSDETKSLLPTRNYICMLYAHRKNLILD